MLINLSQVVDGVTTDVGSIPLLAAWAAVAESSVGVPDDISDDVLIGFAGVVANLGTEFTFNDSTGRGLIFKSIQEN